MWCFLAPMLWVSNCYAPQLAHQTRHWGRSQVKNLFAVEAVYCLGLTKPHLINQTWVLLPGKEAAPVPRGVPGASPVPAAPAHAAVAHRTRTARFWTPAFECRCFQRGLRLAGGQHCSRPCGWVTGHCTAQPGGSSSRHRAALGLWNETCAQSPLSKQPRFGVNRDWVGFVT